jgi:hypothetical protein
MKTLIVFLLMITALPDTHGQLLKKLKEKAAKVVEPKKTDGSNNNPAAAPSANASTRENETGNSAKSPTVPPANGTVVFTLGADENFFYDETKILLKNNKLSYSFIVQNKQYQYFLVEDGNRSGPFKEAPIKSMKPKDDSEDGGSGAEDDAINLSDDRKDPVAIQYSKTIDGKLYLVFNGKNYGPYDHVSKMILSPDKKHFFALVTIGSESPMMAKMGMGICFMVNDGTLKQKIGAGGMSMPLKFSASEGFKHCMGTVMDQKTQTIISVTSANKMQEGSMADMYAGGNIKSFVSDHGDIISIPSQSPTQVLVNGKEAASFKVPIRSMYWLFLTPDISKSVYYERGKLYRADGTEENLTDVLFPKVITVGNETAVYYFKLYKNESGAKDVYLCKKII